MFSRNYTAGFRTSKTYSSICLFLIWHLLPFLSYSQQSRQFNTRNYQRNEFHPGKVVLSPADTLPADDTLVDYLKLIHQEEDTLLYLPVKKTNGNYLNQKTEAFYDSLKAKAENKRITRELYNALFTDTSKKVSAGKVLNLESFKLYENKVIRKITIRRLDVFGPTIEDTTLEPNNFIKRLGNDLHIPTHIGVIRKSILCREGERINPFVLFENERLLRGQPYIQDARFLLSPVGRISDSVDLTILVKDVWPVGFGAELSDFQAGNISLWHNNVLGFGHQFAARFFWDYSKDDIYGNSLEYSVANIWGSYVSGDIYYADRWNLNTYRVNLYRNFMASDINWAGAANLEKTSVIQDLAMRDTSFIDVTYSYRNLDLWIGRSFELGSRMGSWPAKTNLFMAGRYMITDYSRGPETREDSLYLFQDKTQMLVSVGFSRQGFYRSNLIYSFGQTEDVPFGYLIKFTGGIEQGQYKYRPYASLSASAGFNTGRFGYIFGLAEFGSFIYENQLEQGTFHMQIRYFTDLLSVHRFQLRQFLAAEYVLGINRNADEFVSIEYNGGIAGLGSRYLRGDEKILARVESVVFTPYSLFGFRIACFAFADMGTIYGSAFAVSNQNLYAGTGIGIRLRNERLVFNTIQLKFTWYASVPEEANYHSFVASGEQRLHLQNFFMDKPQIIRY
jgi:hypothetical protein